MKIKRSEITIQPGEDTYEARVELPYPYVTDSQETVMLGYGKTKLSAVRDVLRDVRKEFPNAIID
jgi:hypothetical protein